MVNQRVYHINAKNPKTYQSTIVLIELLKPFPFTSCVIHMPTKYLLYVKPSDLGFLPALQPIGQVQLLVVIVLVFGREPFLSLFFRLW